MAGRLSIISDRVDDIPRLLAQLEQMEVRPLLDAYFHAHGHWVGLSLGWVAQGLATPVSWSAVQRPPNVWEGYLMPICRGHTR